MFVVVGAGLRALALAAWWPVSTTLADSWPYAYYATADEFGNPQHPAGYSLFLSAGGWITRDVGAYTIVQHLLAIGAAVLLYFAVKRMCGSPWPGLVGAAVILLGPDQIYLEHTIMSEALFVPLMVAGIYAVARSFDAPERWWPWPILAAALICASAITRSAGLFLLPVVAIAFVFVRPRPWLPRWRPIVAFVGTATVLMLGFATANTISHDRFEFAPTTGWHLYARVAPFAWCGDFEPPKGTAWLCERSTPETRPGADWYLYDPASPVNRRYEGGIGVQQGAGDDLLNEWAQAVVLHQPKTYIENVWPDIWAYFFPGSYRWAPGKGTDLDGQLDWTGPINAVGEKATERGMQSFFNHFTVTRDQDLLGILHDYQRKIRFGATALTISTLLIFAGLLVGPRRNRIAAFVLGIGGLATFVLSSLSIIYIGRYMIPSAGLVAAGGAVGLLSLIGIVRGRLQRRRPAPVATASA
ncbi:hypothetical protein VSS74_04905 [Conexibacter stalactiti]|uniref:Glycosyltransferase RgtA/B/C/D-like domain-containing protein n=1 Tax=Conexibacter stalactiti TaxID=1940611 RepID=A0ABU4HK27_9ACTN|nr:hypothetical protein [Conexibacter stalactiti]MDW5593663.1 hypothetical protein [Conexibacter stalactiti]MEC5034304.1 hypothetical protein [Conexibacter stalactiti]